MSWRGIEGGLAASGAGHDVVMCPNTKACYFDHKPLDSPDEPGQLGVCTVFDAYSYDPISEGMDAAQASHVLGGQGNLWSEMLYFSRQVEYMAFPRLSALAEGLWTPKANRNFDDFSRRLGVHGRRLEKLDVNYYRGALR